MDLSDLETLLGAPVSTETYRDVWVLLDRGAFSLVGHARSLADALGAYVRVILIGETLSTEDAIACGADYVYPSALIGDAEGVLGLLGQLFVQEKPEIVLLPLGSMQNEIASRLAVRLGAGLVTNAFDLRLDEASRRISASRQVYGGDYGLDLTITAPAAIFTLDPADDPDPYRDPGRFGEVIPAVMPDGMVSPLKVRGPAEGFGQPPVPLRKARRIVSVGRGVKDEETLALAKELAHKLDAQVAGDRGALDRGWIREEQVVGVNGVEVAPDLYVAVGIWGDTPHNAGMERARRIVAIHSDPDAPFLQLADDAIVAEPKEILGTLLNLLD